MAEVKLACGLITDVDKHVLLLQRRSPRQLQLPGGRIEAGEVPAAAAIREIDEELEIAVTGLYFIRADAFTQGGTSYFCELFRITTFEGVPRIPSRQDHVYESFSYVNLAARRVGELGLSALTENITHALQNEELLL